MDYEINGKIEEAGSGRGIGGLIVTAMDKDFLFDDELGQVMTDMRGRFHITFDESKFRDLREQAPDIYLRVAGPDGSELITTKSAVRFDAGPRQAFRLAIDSAALAAAGISAGEEPTPIADAALQTLTCLEGADDSDPLVAEIRADLVGKRTVLELFEAYRADLATEIDNDALSFRKLAKLFDLGRTPQELHGHHYGTVPGLRSGDLEGVAADVGNLLGTLWSATVGSAAPWVGKTFTPMTADDRAEVVGAHVPANVKVFRGINHFNEIEGAPINVAATALLNVMWDLDEVDDAERLRYGHERNGGHFAAHVARSIWPGTPREVFRLNYRYRTLGNVPPLTYLVDEVVEVADGLYLGQVLFATARLLERFDSVRDDRDYHYQHFGYFLLFDQDWNDAARRLHPHLEMPAAATLASDLPAPLGERTPQRYSTLTLADPADGNVDSDSMAAIEADLASEGDVLRLMRRYSREAFADQTNDAAVFKKLHTLYNAGVGPKTMNGFFHGALVSWRSHDLLGLFDVNTINVVWEAARILSPWTGKTFDPIDKERLAELTDGHETGEQPTFFGSNTVAFRTARQRVIRSIMRAVGVWSEAATPAERRFYGYDEKTFFFIGKHAASLDPTNNGKPVFQFTYRYKRLRTPPPDMLATDEIVQIADGLYLGQVFYATNVLEPYDPTTPHSVYNYKSFAFFLLMDEHWHSRRLRLGFDLEHA